ncbi:hypothetical protein [Marinomonas sp. CT5]|uniref:hypothetical protein n=1 Tax=Marinomonas sp. CT5 TaxID=2066133 RepID=UPI001BAF90AF|nr:hypothetical protein [Marinomonas sp. CT5]
MNNPGDMERVSGGKQKGWIMVEVILCLALFAIVLSVSQQQSETQWQSLQRADNERKQQENQQKQQAMLRLVGSVSWLTDPQDNKDIKAPYPDCQTCRGNQLREWFYASQHSLLEQRSTQQDFLVAKEGEK